MNRNDILAHVPKYKCGKNFGTSTVVHFSCPIKFATAVV